MLSFTKKQLNKPKRVCVRLKELREKNGMSLKKMAELTKIDERHLRALEDCQFDSLPCGEIYQKNFVKKYLAVLGVDAEPFVAQLLDEELLESKIMSAKPNKAFCLRFFDFSRLPLLIRYGGAIVLVLILVFYLGWQVKRTVEPPKLTLYSPENGHVINQPSIDVAGVTEKEIKVSVNGREIRNNSQGKFSEKVDLSPGLNTIIVTAEKRHGKRTSETRYVILRQS